MTVRPRVMLFQLAALCVLATIGLLYAPPALASSPTTRIIDLTNAQRQRIMGKGCPRLAANAALNSAAQLHASDMARNNYFGHTGLDGRSPFRRMRDAGYRWRRAAENIAAGQPSPEEVVSGWMRSPGHRANILDCRLREIGVGFAQQDGSTYGAYWVQNFGRR